MTTPNNFPFGTNNFVGWNGATTVPLEVRHNGNYPIQWYTDSIQRMQLSPTLVNQNWAWYQQNNLDFSGHLGIGNPVPNPPLTYLHVNSASLNGITVGYRPWMRVGAFFTQGTDGLYTGMRLRGTQTQGVVNWSDDDNAGPDPLSFVFTSTPNNTSVANTLDGLEVARLVPDTSGNEGYLGVGDWFTAGANPTERLDVLDGRLRIRQLPDDAPADSDYVVMVVDTTAEPSGERGVVKWVPASAIASAADCEWTLNPGPFNNVSTAFGPISANCPDVVDAVGMGVDLGSGVAPARLNVRNTNGNANMSAGARVDVTKSGLANGLVVTTTSTGGSAFGMEAASTASGAGTWAFGARFNVTGGGGQSTRGVQALTHGTCNVAIAGDFHAYEVAGTSFGVLGASYNGVNYSWGVRGNSLGTATSNVGVIGVAGNQSNIPVPAGQRTGVYGLARADDDTTVCYGVYGRTTGPDTSGAGGHTKWAGYFDGNTYVSGTVFSTSDEQFKQNIEELPADAAMDKLMQLSPKTYDFNQAAFSYMNLPSEHQYGLIAQEVEAVVPELVTTIHQPAMADSAGTELSPAIDFKAMNYQGLIPLLIAGFQAQQAQIAQLQTRVEQCCAATPGMAPQDGTAPKQSMQPEELKEQRLQIIPNPVAELTTWAYYVPQAGKVVLQVATLDGKPLATLREEMAEPGAYQYTWNTSKLAAGTYLCTYLLDGAVVVQRAVKVAR
ncbi:MAG: tail fiber domain-containing protein [Flavobacteriales bacterium]|nr:tail fiber domain-containing protein [Flavobacteriales bacterium]